MAWRGSRLRNLVHVRHKPEFRSWRRFLWWFAGSGVVAVAYPESTSAKFKFCRLRRSPGAECVVLRSPQKATDAGTKRWPARPKNESAWGSGLAIVDETKAKLPVTLPSRESIHGNCGFPGPPTWPPGPELPNVPIGQAFAGHNDPRNATEFARVASVGKARKVSSLQESALDMGSPFTSDTLNLPDRQHTGQYRTSLKPVTCKHRSLIGILIPPVFIPSPSSLSDQGEKRLIGPS